MLIYAILMFLVAVAFAIVAGAIYKGNTNLIHNYHQTKVTDKSAYGKAFGKALSVMAGAMLLSGAIALLGESTIWGAVAVLLIGLAVGIVAILRVQKKYNGGVF